VAEDLLSTLRSLSGGPDSRLSQDLPPFVALWRLSRGSNDEGRASQQPESHRSASSHLVCEQPSMSEFFEGTGEPLPPDPETVREAALGPLTLSQVTPAITEQEERDEQVGRCPGQGVLGLESAERATSERDKGLIGASARMKKAARLCSWGDEGSPRAERVQLDGGDPSPRQTRKGAPAPPIAVPMGVGPGRDSIGRDGVATPVCFLSVADCDSKRCQIVALPATNRLSEQLR